MRGPVALSSAAKPWLLLFLPVTLGATTGRTSERVLEVGLTTAGGVGLEFDGIGAISGGGATSKLLGQYTPERRGEVRCILLRRRSRSLARCRNATYPPTRRLTNLVGPCAIGGGPATL